MQTSKKGGIFCEESGTSDDSEENWVVRRRLTGLKAHIASPLLEGAELSTFRGIAGTLASLLVVSGIMEVMTERSSTMPHSLGPETRSGLLRAGPSASGTSVRTNRASDKIDEWNG